MGGKPRCSDTARKGTDRDGGIWIAVGDGLGTEWM